MARQSRPLYVVVAKKLADEFMAFLRLHKRRWWHAFEWGFRGQRDASWGLVPSLLRKERWRGFTDHYAEPALVPTAEWHVLVEFKGQADRHGLAVPEDTQENNYIPEYMDCLRALSRLPTCKDKSAAKKLLLRIPPRSLLSQFALAQHFGAPTRLLDWTWKPLVAAYFAASGACETMRQYRATHSDTEAHQFNSENRLAVWAVNTTHLHEIQLKTDDGDQRRVPIEIVQAPQATNRNLAAQAGFFTLDRLATSEVHLEDRLSNIMRKNREYLQEHEIKTILYKITLPYFQAPALLRRLATEGISAASIYPGYDGVLKSLQETTMWDLPKLSGFRSGWSKS